MASKYLLIFDDSILPDRIPYGRWGAQDEVYLFSLSSRSDILKKIMGALKERRLSVHVLENAELIDAAAEKVRGLYIKLIARISDEVKVDGRNLKEWLAVDDTLSLWWPSLISEKNTLKSESFNVLAQMDAIVNTIKDKKIQRIWMGCSTHKLKNALRDYGSQRSLGLEIMRTKPVRDLRRRVRNFQKWFYLKHLALMARFAVSFLLRTWAIQGEVGRLDRPVPEGKGLLFITYYPSFDMAAAQKGIFRNRYFSGLQESLEAAGENITWVTMYVDNNALSLKESLKYMEEFIKRGHIIFFSEEFNSLKIQVRAFLRMLVLGLKFLNIEPTVRKAMVLEDYNCYAIFRDEWYTSFAGATGYFNLMYYKIWQTMFRKVKARKCLYCCEMQGWEKTLISANSAADRIPLLAYQHTAVSRMLLNYFNDPAEMGNGQKYNMPRPNRLICNGRVPYHYLRESGWPEDRIGIAEAIRYEHLKKYLNEPIQTKRDVVLLAFSLNIAESSSLLSFVSEALQGLKDVQLWIKPHPFLSIDAVFRYAGISREAFHFEIKHDSIEELFPHVRVVIAGQSSIAFEALAFGCELITVNMPEQINMSPLKHVKSDFLWNTSSTDGLRKRVESILKSDYDAQGHIREAKKIIHEYFYLNSDSSQPTHFLKELENIDARY